MVFVSQKKLVSSWENHTQIQIVSWNKISLQVVLISVEKLECAQEMRNCNQMAYRKLKGKDWQFYFRLCFKYFFPCIVISFKEFYDSQCSPQVNASIEYLDFFFTLCSSLNPSSEWKRCCTILIFREKC